MIFSLTRSWWGKIFAHFRKRTSYLLPSIQICHNLHFGENVPMQKDCKQSINFETCKILKRFFKISSFYKWFGLVRHLKSHRKSNDLILSRFAVKLRKIAQPRHKFNLLFNLIWEGLLWWGTIYGGNIVIWLEPDEGSLCRFNDTKMLADPCIPLVKNVAILSL